MRESAAVVLALAALVFAAGCSKKEEPAPPEKASAIPKDGYVFAPVTNTCRLIELLENASGDANAVTTRILDVQGLTAGEFRRELEGFPGKEVHLWMPGRHHWLLVGRTSTNRVSLAAAMDALALDDDCTSLPELFANYAGCREDIMPAFESDLRGEVVPEWFITKDIPKVDWLDESGVDADILRAARAEMRSMQVVRRVVLEGDMLAAEAKDKPGEEKAAAAWARAALRNPRDLFIRERLDRLSRNAKGFLEVGKVLPALKCYETMVLIKPDSANVRNFGLCLKKIGKVDMAEKVMRRAEELERAENAKRD